MARVTEEQVNNAVSVLQRDYYQDVRDVYEDLCRAVKDKETDRDDYMDWLHETIDGTQRVIYTFQARCGMLVTANPDAYTEDFGEEPRTVEQAMYAAMMRDVQDLIDQYALPEEREEEVSQDE